MISHLVLYKTYKRNRRSSEQMISEARRLLEPIVTETGGMFHVARATSFERVVSGPQFDVGLYAAFRDLESYLAYMGDPKHLNWCQFVLRGWKLAGSLSGDTQSEFLDYILNAPQGAHPCRRQRDGAPDNQVVWDGEEVIDFGDVEQHRFSSSTKRYNGGTLSRFAEV